MTLVQSWIDSLALLKPKNLQLFVMVTIKSIIEAYKLYVRYFWWLLLIIVICFFIAPDYLVSFKNRDTISLASYATILGIVRSLYGILFLAVCFITRPSIVQKNCNYLRTHYKKIIVYWLLWFVLMTASSVWMILVPLFIVSSYSSGYIFSVLFFADSEGGLKSFLFSLWNALKMIVYNCPLLLIMGICFYLPVLIFNSIFFISPLMKHIIAAILLPIGVCTYTNIYIKKLHDQFDLYFNRAQ